MILQVHRDFFNSEIGTAEAERAQVLGLKKILSLDPPNNLSDRLAAATASL
jgi:hypothetical protein